MSEHMTDRQGDDAALFALIEQGRHWRARVGVRGDAHTRYLDAFAEAVQISPQTVTGARALLEWVKRECEEVMVAHESLSALVAGLLASPVLSVAVVDTDLPALGRELDAAWREELAAYLARPRADDPQVLATEAATSVIVERIVAIPATSLDGMRVKAQAFAWAHGGFDPNDRTDMRVLTSLMRDLIATKPEA